MLYYYHYDASLINTGGSTAKHSFIMLILIKMHERSIKISVWENNSCHHLNVSSSLGNTRTAMNLQKTSDKNLCLHKLRIRTKNTTTDSFLSSCICVGWIMSKISYWPSNDPIVCSETPQHDKGVLQSVLMMEENIAVLQLRQTSVQSGFESFSIWVTAEVEL